MKIKSFQGGFDKNLSYLIWCDKTKIAAIVDPAVEITPIIELINKNNLILSKLFITHTHHDHIYYIEDIKYLYPNIDIICSNITKNISFSFYGVVHNETVSLGEEFIICLETPGHYYNSICFWNKSHSLLFTGDTMFVGRTGRTIDRTSNINNLYNSIYNIILNLPKQTMIYPGHHYGYSQFISIHDNIVCSDFFRCKTLDEFIKIMEKFELNR